VDRAGNVLPPARRSRNNETSITLRAHRESAETVGRIDGRRTFEIAVSGSRLLFAYRIGAATPWQWLPQPFDASILSDEATAPGLPDFTGALVGMACQDLAGSGQPADFDWFEYRERDYLADVASEAG
jgi:beta-xylosidase